MPPLLAKMNTAKVAVAADTAKSAVAIIVNPSGSFGSGTRITKLPKHMPITKPNRTI